MCFDIRAKNDIKKTLANAYIYLSVEISEEISIIDIQDKTKEALIKINSLRFYLN